MLSDGAQTTSPAILEEIAGAFQKLLLADTQP
jgi:hypothetical protein